MVSTLKQLPRRLRNYTCFKVTMLTINIRLQNYTFKFVRFYFSKIKAKKI